jgi:sensor histidine kinase YesM
LAARRSITRRYLWLQIGGWGILCLILFSISLVYLQYSHHTLTRKLFGQVVLSYALYLIYGLAASHLLHLGLRRWITLPLRALLPRLVPLFLGAAALMSALMIAINDRLLHITLGKVDRGIAVSLYVNNCIMLFGWVIVYALIHTVRERRRDEARRLELELAAQEAQYRSLSARVNPHFLFNALNTIRALMYEDRAQADLALNHLASLLRAGLRGEERREIPLKDELAVVDDYLQLEQMRFEHRLKVRCEITDEARRALVPPMAIQHLVENAVKHGIARIERGGEIVLHSDIADNTLRIVVTNPLPAATSTATEVSGTGLENSRQRLRLLYGTDAALHLRLDDTIATATLTLPLKEEETDHAHTSD